MTLFAHHQPSSQNMVKMSRSVVKDTATSFMTIVRLVKINSQLSRCSKATGSGVGLSLGGPTKVKSFQFTEGSLEVLNKEHLVDFVVTL